MNYIYFSQPIAVYQPNIGVSLLEQSETVFLQESKSAISNFLSENSRRLHSVNCLLSILFLDAFINQMFLLLTPLVVQQQKQHRSLRNYVTVEEFVT